MVTVAKPGKLLNPGGVDAAFSSIVNTAAAVDQDENLFSANEDNIDNDEDELITELQVRWNETKTSAAFATL